MAWNTKVEWVGITWNPLTGCTKMSPGCEHCYAERMALRLRAMGHPHYQNGFHLTLHEDVLEQPLSWKKSQIVFVNFMGDLFHEDVPNEFIQRVFDVMRKAPWHRFQVLTKRSERLREFSTEIDWPGNVWMGVSIENQDYIFRANHLRETKAQIKFLLLEPLLGPIAGLDLSGIDWVIVGGESGPGARPLSEEWVVGIYNQCMESGVPFFFQRWGDVKEKRVGRTEGGTWEETPIVIKVRGGTE